MFAQALGTFRRIVVRHWPALMACYLAGEALHRLFVQLAGMIGGHTTLGGLLVLPLAVAARLGAYVAMYLAVRPSLPALDDDPEGGIRSHARSILTVILPFVIFYTAWGMLNVDLIEFMNVASAIAFQEVGYELDQLGDRGGIISIGVLPVIVLVVALIARIALARYAHRLPTWCLALAAYAELLWTFMLLTVVAQWWTGAKETLAGSAAARWLQSFGDWFALNIAPVAVAWEAVLWIIGILSAVLLLPAAWLAVAGVVYGTRFDDAPPLVDKWLSAVRGTAGTLSRSLLQRFESLWAAVAVVWRGGPVLFGATACAYALWALAERTGMRGVLQLIGGHGTDFWDAFLPLISVGIAVIAEPLRVAIVATAYDAVIARPQAGLDSGGSGLDDDSHVFPDVTGQVQEEGAIGIVGKQEDGEDAVGRDFRPAG